MEIIKQKLATSKRIIEDITAYNDKLFPLLEGIHEVDKRDIISVSEKFARHFKTIDTNSAEYDAHPSLTTAIAFYKSYHDLYNDLQNLIYMYDRPFIHPEQIDGSDLSQTYKLTTGDMLHDLLNEYNKYCVKYANVDKDFMEYLITNSLTTKTVPVIKSEHTNNANLDLLDNDVYDNLDIDDGNNYDDNVDDVIVKDNTPQSVSVNNTMSKRDIKKYKELIEQMHNAFLDDLTLIEFYAAVMQKYMDVLYDNKTAESKQVMYYAMSLIEQAKDIYLTKQTTNVFDKSVNKHIHKEGPALRRFDLLPITECMPLADIMHKITKGQSTSRDLKKYASAHDAAFIIMSKVVYTPVEYNIQPLISRHLAKPLIQRSSVGITQKIINRFKTIKIPEGKKIFYKWNFAYEIIGNQDTAKVFYILETLDDQQYRLMAPWLDASNFALPKFRVEKLLSYINNNNEPTRASGYHTMACKLMASKMFLRKPISVDDINEKSMELDTQLIRNTLYMEQSRRINDLISKSELKDDSDINTVIHDESIRSLFRDIILQMYSSGTGAKFDAGRFSFSELIASFLVDLETLVNRFMKELHDGYNRNTLPKSVFSEKHDHRVNLVSKRLEEVLVKALMTVLSDKDNIYSSINYKYLLLNFH